ncbi:YdeI/OmpD-associated family protein [Heyndrickxia sp. NPDC080065]|uniref:YdeI/OmpD-associated family protein n=1 Tax=Heyndrickxia sp. NPDC080065 TaxID=3390568 RepID=UPI003CFFB6FA
MEIENLLNISTRQELREWLTDNSTKETSCWIPLSISPKPNLILGLDAVEEALCFGWIDNSGKKTPDGILAGRFTPRRKNSSWTELNKERVRRLERLGLMTDEGRKCLPDMSESSFKIHPRVMQALKSNPGVYEKFLEFPELYRRVRVDTIQSCLKKGKKQEEVFEQRLNKLIENTQQGKMYGAWNDSGRLLEN